MTETRSAVLWWASGGATSRKRGSAYYSDGSRPGIEHRSLRLLGAGQQAHDGALWCSNRKSGRRGVASTTAGPNRARTSEVRVACEPIPVDVLHRLLVLDRETGFLTWRPRSAEMFPSPHAAARWNGAWAGKRAFNVPHSKGYLKGTLFGRSHRSHRVVWALVHGSWPKADVDHINGVKTDNRPQNLRLVTAAENAKNRRLRPHNTSGVNGVRRDPKSGGWLAYIGLGGVTVHLGSFDTLGAAAAARRSADIKYGFHENHGKPIDCR